MKSNGISPSQDAPHLRFIGLSLAASLITLLLKFGAARITGSVGLFSDAVESSANVMAALTALFALWYAAHPADRSHPYGHRKIEFFSSGIEGGLILVASASIVWTALHHFQKPQLPQELGWGLGLALLATAINYFVGRALLNAAHKLDSIVLEADGHHLLSDVWTSLGVVVGLLLANATKLAWLDPLLALLVGLNIARIGWDLLRRSFDGLMDKSLSPGEVRQIQRAIESKLEDGMGYHALRTRRAGEQRFADYHLLVPGHISVRAAHDCEMQIGAAIENALPAIEVTSHIEPIEEPAAYNDSPLPDARSEIIS
ncbi:MAG TPA: cation diffusion facilitator family transporter [Abditibacteriaceae bacterium]|jgi:cation diffusion facilitator family transporter